MRFIVTNLIIFFVGNVFGQPTIQWEKSLGGSSNEWPFSIQQTTDTGFITVGSTASNNGDVTVNYGLVDVWLVKLDVVGNIQWQKSYGGSGLDNARFVLQTADQGFIISGGSSSNDGDLSSNYGLRDAWIIKVDSIGSIQWQKSYGGSDEDALASIQSTTDGGYILAGWTASNDFDVTFNYGGFDFWIIKIDSIGNLQWQKTFGGSNDDEAWSIRSTIDDGFIIAGSSSSNDGDVTGNHGSSDMWVVKLDSLGNLQWERTYGGSGIDLAYDIQLTNDQGYIISGSAMSYDGDVTGLIGLYDYWIVKIDSVGNIKWQKTFGGTDYDSANSIKLTSDNGFIVAGGASSNNFNVTNYHGGQNDGWIVKLDSTGTLLWEKTLGGTGNDLAFAIIETNDLGFLVAAGSNSLNGQVTGNNGAQDFWIVKLSVPNYVLESNLENLNISTYPNPSNEYLNVSFILQSQTEIKLDLYNTLGQVVKTISKGKLPEGKNETKFSVTNIPVGIYHLKFSAGEEVVVKRVVKM